MRPISKSAILAGILSFLAIVGAQGQTPTPWPFASPSSAPAASASAWPFAQPGARPISSPGAGTSPATGLSDDQPPPNDIPLVEKTWDQISDHEVGDYGEIALAMKPDKWRHAETDNFYLHYRRVTEAKKVAREVEYDLWFVAKSLGAKPEQYRRRKSHVFIFEDENEWRDFLNKTEVPSWVGSFAHHDELFLSVRNMERGGAFDSITLAHETTHAVVARLYPFEHWPVWLNEGFAEYMANISVATRNHQPIRNYQHQLNEADMSLDDLFATKVYPADRMDVYKLYQSSEKFVRFLMTQLPKERFHQFVTTLLSSHDPKASILAVYGDKIHDFDTFEKKYNAFSN